MVSDWWQKWSGYKFLAQDNVTKFLFKKLKQNKICLVWSPVLPIYIAGYLSSRNKSLHQVNVMQVCPFSFEKKIWTKFPILFWKQSLNKTNVIQNSSFSFSKKKFWTKLFLFRIFFFFSKGKFSTKQFYSKLFLVFSKKEIVNKMISSQIRTAPFLFKKELLNKQNVCLDCFDRKKGSCVSKSTCISTSHESLFA